MHLLSSSRARRSPRFILVIVSILILTGCVDLTSVVTFSQISAQTASYTAIVSDFVDSTNREVRYNPNNADLQKAAAEAAKDQAGLLAIQQAVTDYMTALGKLAVDQQSGVAKASSTLVANMATTKLITEGDKTAATSLADLVVRLAAEGYQKKKLAGIIERTNTPFQELISTLKEFVGTEYPAEIASEEAILKQTLFEDIADNNQLGNDQRPVKSIASILYSERMVALEAKKTTAKAYLPILEKIGAGHQALYDNRDKLDAKELAAELKNYSTDIKTIYNQLKP